MAWAEARIGPERIKGAYAWRSLRRSGARLVLSSDLPATDYNVFYGLHSAITRQDKSGQPPGGWRSEERLTPEEAVRGFTSWAAYSEFAEGRSGTIAAGGRADLTVIDVDPLTVASDKLLGGHVTMTIAHGTALRDNRSKPGQGPRRIE